MGKGKQFAKKTAFVIPAFIAGTIVTGTLASAATTYIQAQKESNSSVYVDGVKTATPPSLAYGNTTYMGLWWLQQGLQKAGYQATWDGHNFKVTSPARPTTDSSIAAVDGYKVSAVAQGTSSMKGPDDIATLNGNIFVAYQNGVGSKGEASSSGATASTIVEYDHSGNQVASWTITGKCDGLGADPANNHVIATVNEDGNSSMYVITPGSAQAQHITYAVDPATAQSGPIATGGGTDSIAVQNGHIYISASAPSADTNGNYTHAAVFEATIQGNTATLSPVLMGNGTATDASTGNSVTLNLSDPDSSTIVPASSPKYANDLMLDSQGDSELIFVQNPGTSQQSQTKLSVGTQVDDVQWVTSSNGTLYVTDGSDNKVYAITGQFTPGTVFVACPSDSGVAGFVGTLDLSSGTITPVVIGLKSPKGLLFSSNNQ